MVFPRRRALVLGTAAAILMLGAVVAVGILRRAAAERLVEHTYGVMRAADRAFIGLVSAETGQRGYILTGLDAYLEPYHAGLRTYDSVAAELRRLTLDNPEQQHRLDTLENWVSRRRHVLDSTLQIRRTKGLEAATTLLQTNRGKAMMDSVRRVAAEIGRAEMALLAERQAVETRRAWLVYLLTGLATAGGVGLVLVQGGLLSRALGAQEILSAELSDRAKTLEETAAELEMSNEELQSSNEQLQATLEELQTTTEELETTNTDLSLAIVRFRTLVESLPAPLFVCRPTGETTYLNPAWIALTGVPADQALKNGWTATVHPDDRGRIAEAWQSALHGQRAELHYRHTRSDGSVRHVRTVLEPVRDDRGVLSDILGMGIDLTERLEHEEQLRHAQRMQAVGRLAGGMAHELNNMLTASIGFSFYALRRLPADHPAAPDISESLKAQERAARITSQVLSFSRRQMLAPVRFEVNGALEDLVPLLRQSLEPGQTLRMELGQMPAVVHLDRTRLDQAIINLTLNARDAMSASGKLRVQTRLVNVAAGELAGPEGERIHAGTYLLIALTDDGLGMDPETRRRALEPFFTTKPVGQGTGLGLSMAYGFVRQSGGTLSIESELGRGTTIRLYLPTVAAMVLERPVIRDGAGLASQRREHVLIVEDEPSVRGTMRRALEDQGYRVLEASTGAEALDRLAAADGNVRLVVCDLVMPQMSGETLGKAIGVRWPALRVLYVSGFPGADGEEGMMPAGAPFLKKPFSPEELAVRVREELERA